MMTDEKLIKVQFTYDTGRIQTLEGDAAEAWLKNVDECSGWGLIYSVIPKMTAHPWKESHVKQDED